VRHALWSEFDVLLDVPFCVGHALVEIWQVKFRAGNSSSLSSTTQSISGVGLIWFIAWGCQVNSGTDQ